MIHQCYFAEGQRSRLFNTTAYRGFGLDTVVNPDVTRKCPELEDPRHRVLLAEYGAMLHHWRNPELDTDGWIGFTSYRQTDKFPTVFTKHEDVAPLLAQAEVVGWGGYQFLDARTGQPISLAEGSERSHLGIVSCLWKLLMLRDERMPIGFVSGAVGLFCNYWAMSRASFEQYMEWSFPLVRYCLTNPDAHVQSHPRSVGYLAERLFILWYMLREKRLMHVGQVQNMPYFNPFYVPARATATNGEQFIRLSNWHVTLDELCRRHGVRPRGIVHVGAHYGEERDVYRDMGVGRVLWIEADPANMQPLRDHVAGEPGHRAVQACVADSDGRKTPFYRTSNSGESSSILPLGTHKEMFSHIHVAEQMTLETVTFPTLAERERIDLDDYDFLVMDIQGAELIALRGFGELLYRFKGVYLEVNLQPLYEGCALIGDIDAFLAREGFSRRETMITQSEYGDALYLRDATVPRPPADLEAQVERARAAVILARRFTYRLAGLGERTLELLNDFRVGEGKGQLEQFWLARGAGQDVLMELIGAHGRTCSLRQDPDGVWRGRVLFDRAPAVELVPHR